MVMVRAGPVAPGHGIHGEAIGGAGYTDPGEGGVDGSTGGGSPESGVGARCAIAVEGRAAANANAAVVQTRHLWRDCDIGNALCDEVNVVFEAYAKGVPGAAG